MSYHKCLPYIPPHLNWGSISMVTSDHDYLESQEESWQRINCPYHCAFLYIINISHFIWCQLQIVGHGYDVFPYGKLH